MKVLASLLFSPVGGGAVIGGASWGRSISLDRGGFRDEASHRSSVSGVYKAKKKRNDLHSLSLHIIPHVYPS